MIKIDLIGMFVEPGARMVTAQVDVVEFLRNCGGIQKDGSLRKISLLRRNGEAHTIDLYSYFKDMSDLPVIRMRAGDRIQVPMIGATIAIVGVAREGIYEIADKDKDLWGLVSLSGGLNNFAKKSKILLSRTDGNEKRTQSSLFGEQSLRAHEAQDGDIIRIDMISPAVQNSYHLKGAVLYPGSYPITDGLRIKDIVDSCGGFLISASLKELVVVRQFNAVGDPEVLFVDMLALMSGDEKENILIQRMDIIKILKKVDIENKKSVRIIGAIRKSGSYEMSANMDLQKLIKMSGGPLKDAYNGKSFLVRRVYGQNNRSFDVKTIVFDLQQVVLGQGSAKMILQDGDSVVLRQIRSRSITVRIDGQVQFPGSYILSSNARISDLLVAAGGLQGLADLRAAAFYRKSVSELQQSRLKMLIKESREQYHRNSVTMMGTARAQEANAAQADMIGLEKVANNMRTGQSTGRIVLNLVGETFLHSEDDLVLENGDHLHLPKVSNFVLVLGRVYNSNAFLWREKVSVKDYLKMAGGIRADVDRKDIYLVL
ncbi:MAG: SLBB domain-containing protein, partial [Planctomycetes bacterium]|nr:SLBB domain-containing protein [Planctomycetota bacterium]